MGVYARADGEEACDGDGMSMVMGVGVGVLGRAASGRLWRCARECEWECECE